jgi:ribosomal protein S18 acetylase RimI-like enzyme
MEVRAAKANDVPAVLPMVRKLCELHRAWDSAKYDFVEGIEEMYRGWLTARSTDPRAVFLVAAREELGPIGFLIGTVEKEIPIYRLKEFGFIHDLWVEEDYRHEGVARQLVMQAIERFAEIGVSQVRLDTAAPNETARHLFERCGFRPGVIEMLSELNGKSE